MILASIRHKAILTVVSRVRRFLITVYRIFYPLLRQSERDFERAKEVVKRGWVLLLEIAEKAKKRGLWQLKAATWDNYCKAVYGIGADRLSHFRNRLPYAEAILASGYQQIIPEGRLREMAKHVPKDSPYIAQTYRLSEEVAKELGRKAPSAAIFRRAHEILEEAAMTGGTVAIGDNQIIPILEGAEREVLITATIQKLKEVREIAIQGLEPKKYRVHAQRIKGNVYKIISDHALPDTLEFLI